MSSAGPRAVAVLVALVVSAAPVSVAQSTPRSTTATAATPGIARVSPQHGPSAGGTRVVLHGQNFDGGDATCGPVTAVSFGGYPGVDEAIPASRFSVDSDSRLTAVTPASYAGPVDVQIQTSCGASLPVARDRFTFRYHRAGECLTGSCPLTIHSSSGTNGSGHRIRHVASGLLNGDLEPVTPAETTLIDKLHLRSWRIGNGTPSSLAVAQNSGAATTFLLESDWLACPSCGDVSQPWLDPAAFEAFVENDVRTRELDGTAPRYWDVWNEPTPTATADQWLSVYDAAYRGAHAADPNARVVGPSLATFDLPALRLFVAHATDLDEAFAAVSYHDEGGAGAPLYAPRLLAAHARALRGVLRTSPVLRGSKVFVNEYGPIAAMREPGWIVGDMAALETPAIAQADYTCPTSPGCVRYFDGLIGVDGTPQLSYWIFRSFAAVTGTRDAVTTAGSNVTAIAATDRATSAVRILVGRHDDCGTPPEQWVNGPVPEQTCPTLVASTDPVVSVPLQVRVPVRRGVARITIRTFHNPTGHAVGHDPTPNAPRATSYRVPIRHGAVRIHDTSFGNGDAASVVVRYGG